MFYIDKLPIFTPIDMVSLLYAPLSFIGNNLYNFLYNYRIYIKKYT